MSAAYLKASQGAYSTEVVMTRLAQTRVDTLP